jgi:two-component system chemotaxis sensor kinase CheA
MPKMDGYEVIKRVKTNPEWASIPIVVMTAHSLDRSQVDLLSLTAGQISKPLSAEGIAEKVDQLVAASRPAEV